MNAMAHSSVDLISLFAATFQARYNTVLVGGGEEPVYLPADDDCPRHRIVFTRDYFASALHEIAHWCIAGEQRRRQVDYGYWYQPDGRDAEQQAVFQQVEARPQAIEWAFSLACNAPFRISLDNLDGDAGDAEPFRQRVLETRLTMEKTGFPPRAKQFIAVLRSHYRSQERKSA